MNAVTGPPPPLSRWSSVWRYALVVLFDAVLLAFLAAEVWASDSPVSPDRAFVVVVVDVVVGLLGLVVVSRRRQWPIGVVVTLTLAACFASSAAAAWSLAVVSLATRRRWKEVVPLGVLSLFTPLVYDRINPASAGGTPWWVTYVFGVLVYAILTMMGFYVGARRELLAGLRARVETAEREQAMRVAQAREQERTRIAREMHDVLAHRISLVAMHAGALSYRTDLTADEIRRAATVIQEGAHGALSDLREVLGVLRDPAATADEPRRPQPTLADLPALVEEAVEGGSSVTLIDRLSEAPGTPRELEAMRWVEAAGTSRSVEALDAPRSARPVARVPDAAGRTIYRMVQEALTNARKHAPGMPVTVTLGGTPGDRLELEVTNPLRLHPPGRSSAADPETAVPGAGMGLTGLAERAALAGGGMEHSDVGGREFVVRAWLPWPS